jgi:endonuclease VIII
MPEGDTIHYAANRIRPVLEGCVPEEIRTPQRRHERDRWADRLAGRAVARVEARGKHLLLHFEGDLVVHSHLRMTGAWAVHRTGERWRRAPRRAWLVMCAGGQEVVQFDGPLLELLTEARSRSDPQLACLGQDVIGERFDEALLLRRLREDDPTRPFGDALLDQRTIAGIGNIWKSETLFACGVNPFVLVETLSDAEVHSLLESARKLMGRSANTDSRNNMNVYSHGGEPCRRCRTAIASKKQGLDARLTY